jgi:type I restriction enzyme R subunit
MPFTESAFENAILEIFRDHLGYQTLYGPDFNRDYHHPFIEFYLREGVRAANPGIPDAAVDEALHRLRDLENGSLVQKNERFMDYLQNGIEVSFFHEGRQKSALVRLLDYGNTENNSFLIANQWTFIENAEKRVDLVVFVNGMPLVLMEIKSPSREETDVSAAYRQIRNYTYDIPSLFHYNAFIVISDMASTRAGTLTAAEDRFMEWKTVDGDYENTSHASFDVLFRGMFDKSRFLEIIRSFICFSKENEGDQKILAGYHQYFAVKKAVASTHKATLSDGKGGVFWHTQGSGKSLSMVFYARLLQEALEGPTVIVMTDRNDLDNQLYGQFAKCKDFLRQTPQQAESRVNLRELLEGRAANGIIFTTMQKFEEVDEPLCQRRNLIVMADEAHRGQYGLEAKVDPVTGRVQYGTAKVIRDNLPHATFIGFTGTPIELRDHNTREIFGDYIDIYDMTQSVEDGATRPIYYESRVIQLKLDEGILHRIDAEYEEMMGKARLEDIQRSQRELSQLESILGAPETIEALCEDIVQHYEDCRQNVLTGKAMIVAYSREIAIKIHRKLLELRPAWKDKVRPVMTGSNDDPEDWRAYTGNKLDKAEWAKNFKKDDNPFKIAIVVDMWLTGFDVPSLATMYVYKPMQGHNLMQAIARVNRVYKDKEGGLIVDYIGIARALKEAMSDYTGRDQAKYGNMDVAQTAYLKFLEKLEICTDLFYPFDFQPFFEGSDLDRANVITDGTNFMADTRKTERKENYLREALMLKQAYSLCKSLASERQRLKAAFFEAVRTILNRVVGPGPISLKEINARINELLKQSIKSEGVINLFTDVKDEFSIFDPKFLEEIAKLKGKNLAIELLRKLLSEQVSRYRASNIVKSEKFSKLLQETMNSYLNGLISNEEVISELLRLAEQIAAERQKNEAMGITEEEMAFYDALTKPEAVKDFFENEELIAIAKELTDTLRKNRTIDWQKKETARARMRLMVKKLLRKHKYPPEGLEFAIDTVIQQCEVWTDVDVA